jgi:UPF0271 protein
MAEMQIDLNCDLGEGCGQDAELMPLITSANISCGFHAGDVRTARLALDLAAQHGVQVGAHPGYPDRANFGRRELAMSADELLEVCVYQVGALDGLTHLTGQSLRYVKPHGALYNQACRDAVYAEAVAVAAAAFDLPVMGLPNSQLASRCTDCTHFVPEGFADRRYQPDGSLVPRSRLDAMIEDPVEAALQAKWLIREQGVQTLCVHGDNPQAVAFVRTMRAALIEAGFTIRAFA